MKRAVLVAGLALGAALPASAQVDSLTSPADTTAARAAPAADPAETVRLLETRRQTALVAADTKTLAEIIAEDATYVHANGLMQTRGELFAMLERGEMRYVSFLLEDVRYRSYGGTVVGTGVQRIDVNSAGKSMVLRSRYTVVYAVSTAGAKLVAYQSTPTPKMSTRP